MIRRYNTKDQNNIIQLFKLNVPIYFHPTEEMDLVHYLENKIEDYFVFENNKEILGAGGINYEYETHTAIISWDFIHPLHHKKGIGRQLIQHRLEHIQSKKDLHSIRVRTTQLTYKFYEKMGFKLKEIQFDYWEKDLHLYLMTRSI